VLAFAGNLLQVYGVIVWGWDMFQILMLYWMETAVIGFWGLLRLAVLPERLLGEMTVNGRVVAATNELLLLMFVPFVTISMAAHLLILWAVFAGNSAAGVHGRSASPRTSSSHPAPGSRCCSRGLRARSASIKARNAAFLHGVKSPMSPTSMAMVSEVRSAARSAAS
jgi:hypothetical protein